MKIKALILTAALISSAAVGAAAYAAAEQARTRANAPRPAAASTASADAPSSSDPGKKTPRANAPTAAGQEGSAVPEEPAASESAGAEVTGAIETEPAEPTERAATGELTAPAALQDPVGEGECLLTLRGDALYVTTLRSFGGEVVYSRALPEGRRLSARDAARLEAGIIYGSPEAAVAAVWELLT